MTRRLKEKIECQNPACGAEFRQYNHGQRYCSRACYYQVLGKNKRIRTRTNNARLPVIEKECRECGHVFKTRTGRFCSGICYQIHRSRQKPPAHAAGATCKCGKTLPESNRRYCSRDCYRQSHANLEKKNRWQLRHEKDDQRRQWQADVIVDQNLTCIQCGVAGKTVNHKMIDPQQIRTINNRKEFCISCYMISISEYLRAGVCLDCGDKINRFSIFCRACSKTRTHKHGQFIPFPEIAETMIGLDNTAIKSLHNQHRQQSSADAKVKSAQLKEFYIARRAEIALMRQEKKKHRSRHESGWRRFKKGQV